MGPWSPLCAFLLIFFIHGTCSQKCLCARGFCERGWVQYQNTCYKAVKEKMTWTDAEMACQSYGRNSHLASIHSTEENDFIFHLMDKPTDYTKGQAYWIGAHDTFKEGIFVWTDGSRFDFRTFSPPQPDGLPGENYLASWFLLNGFVTWNDYVVSWKFMSVCKYYLESSCCVSQGPCKADMKSST
ncbi:C-type lectin LmsL-like [Rhineura floridana]|uniref:C-type lectin LmsL-like n=1 Tax=Rhineura floridana TaxID=261503 RepID=UPI002AC88009|nr:C-type lectin LmsL-like [Rhineura floridana]XP_061469021.1 C-type lectin LmsL-like [Rhineura floridana]XP_061469022.1 C-type lectin LmsL-like [Rhineura floridana]